MAYPIERKLVIGIASSALFNLSESDKVFRIKGEDAYRKYQRAKEKTKLEPGVAFPLVRRLLQLNDGFSENDAPVLVIGFLGLGAGSLFIDDSAISWGLWLTSLSIAYLFFRGYG